MRRWGPKGRRTRLGVILQTVLFGLWDTDPFFVGALTWAGVLVVLVPLQRRRSQIR